MKRTYKSMLSCVMAMIALACTKEPFSKPVDESIQNQDNAIQETAGHYIGERFGGGVIFFLGTAGRHGLIADTVDLPDAAWCSGDFTNTGATGKGMRDGLSNTLKIISSQGNTGVYAALETANSTRNGYTDWFLPSSDELKELYNKRRRVGDFRAGVYWTSTEQSEIGAWGQDFTNGMRYSLVTKQTVRHVRAVRAF